MKELNALFASPLPTATITKATNGMGKPHVNSLFDSSDVILIGDMSNSHTPPFPLTFEIFNKNVHNFLVDLRASSNIMPYSVCLKLNISPQKFIVHIVQLNRKKGKIIGEMNSILIRLSSNPKFYKIIDILVANIPYFYGLILSWDWSAKTTHYFSTIWS